MNDVAKGKTTSATPSLILALGGSFFLFTGSFVLDQAFRWSDPLAGIANGIFHIPITGVGWLIYGLIPTLLIYALYRWQGWARFRTLAFLLPAFPVLFTTIANLISNPTTPESRLKKYTGADLPATAREIHTHFTGGGICDYGDTYAFRCSAADTAKLIETLNLTEANPGQRSGPFHRPAPDWPDPSTWADATTYVGGTENEVWYFFLTTDSTREQVFIYVY
jgi:hypothetical protein